MKEQLYKIEFGISKNGKFKPVFFQVLPYTQMMEKMNIYSEYYSDKWVEGKLYSQSDEYFFRITNEGIIGDVLTIVT